LQNATEETETNQIKEVSMQKGEHLVIIGCGGVGGPAAMLSKKLMPDIRITVIRDEDRFIVR
jgi:D-arabinose 1-dehydrogenase-like Zn-dependent alcohol dehydrogenase